MQYKTIIKIIAALILFSTVAAQTKNLPIDVWEIKP